jgi:tRNA threonylcarbamoyladenosine biosynthesis protein TsaB
MKLLALDTATERLALGVAHGARSWHLNAPGGALASTTLIPAALAGLSECGLTCAALDGVACGIGPGAFTGLRTAVSVAQGLAFGAGKPVLAIDSLLIVAEDARAQSAAERAPGAPFALWVAMDARMDELYAAAYRHDGQAWQVSQAPALYDLAALGQRWQAEPPAALAGSALSAFGERLPVAGVPAWPQEADRAAALLRLARQAWADGPHLPPEQLQPVYLRDKVALTTAERAAARPAVVP